jgi:hypothetical protein
MAYNIQIDEAQRAAPLELIKNRVVIPADDPLEYWDAMLAELPEVEASDPGTTHGFLPLSAFCACDANDRCGNVAAPNLT